MRVKGMIHVGLFEDENGLALSVAVEGDVNTAEMLGSLEMAKGQILEEKQMAPANHFTMAETETRRSPQA